MLHAPLLSRVDFDAVAGLVPANITAALVASRGGYWESFMSSEVVVDPSAKSRRPVYFPRDPSVRIVSRPNGMWRVERRVAEHGSREYDNWASVSLDTTRGVAIQRLLGAAKVPL
jgi:hypothetical protein